MTRAPQRLAGTPRAARPPGAKLALQPLVSLARLRIRDGDSEKGYQVPQSLYDAARSPDRQVVTNRRGVSITVLIEPDGIRETAARWLVGRPAQRRPARLVPGGCFTDALRQTGEHDSIGHRLLDGRQAVILALAADGPHRSASSADGRHRRDAVDLHGRADVE